MNILIINCGSSSVKYQLIDISNNVVLVTGLVERIGQADTRHSVQQRQANGEMKKTVTSKATETIHDAFDMVQKAFSGNNTIAAVSAIGHRVVHGGERFTQPTLIDKNVLKVIQELSVLAPLHNPANLTGIEVCLKLFPELPQVAVFDTAFHQSMPEHAYRYAVPEKWYSDYKVRRYGFHGTSHAYVSKQAAEHLKIPINKLNAISLHLGNGASVAAIKNGKCIDTSMGLTPLEGLVMGTRCGDLDPAIPFYIADVSGASNHEISSVLNKQSGLKGLCGENDMREVQRLAKEGDHPAQLALDSYCYRIKKYIGAYSAVLGTIDVLIFTAGIGENSAIIRSQICHNLSSLGIALDNEKNNAVQYQVTAIETSTARCKILVIKTNEELEIAQQTVVCIQNKNT
ncbi:MAG: acetate/propionate family kinase [Thiohalomonadales bacterium]